MSQTKIAVYELPAKNIYAKMSTLETNISYFQAFLFDLSPLTYEGNRFCKEQGHFVQGDRQKYNIRI